MLVLPHLSWEEAKSVWHCLDKDQVQYIIVTLSFKIMVRSANVFALDWKCLQARQNTSRFLVPMTHRYRPLASTPIIDDCLSTADELCKMFRHAISGRHAVLAGVSFRN